ncbi:MAG: hypothetical protein H0A76_12730 [Candidatus Thiodubiliella endoseptemdiera]|uniref:Uncharacterized protein n=1 Tax=Candidatus Thiodubiliella endoseptemdiera TaxID=2738886 RepID=A0A853F546_9GAMM|nr:hypothetical protein [Candidatus Thiodubiliella endoseptemdiera]
MFFWEKIGVIVESGLEIKGRIKFLRYPFQNPFFSAIVLQSMHYLGSEPQRIKEISPAIFAKPKPTI